MSSPSASRSDSSMVDEYHFCSRDAMDIEGSSDSSMVDEYPPSFLHGHLLHSVQIPLWSMSTCLSSTSGVFNAMFRFLYGRWVPPVFSRDYTVSAKFRFLYGRWVQLYLITQHWSLTWFRFLYGRWVLKYHPFRFIFYKVQIPLWSMSTLYVMFVQLILDSSDSSMVDEYYWLLPCQAIRWHVQIPLWSMNTGLLTYVMSKPDNVQIPLWSMNTSDRE